MIHANSRGASGGAALVPAAFGLGFFKGDLLVVDVFVVVLSELMSMELDVHVRLGLGPAGGRGRSRTRDIGRFKDAVAPTAGTRIRS